MEKRIPPDMKSDDDLVPGGDLRSSGNNWLRSAYKASGLDKVPRENKIRQIVKKLMKKKGMGFSITILGLNDDEICSLYKFMASSIV